MKIKLRLFTTNYEAQLKANAQSGILDAYNGDEFDYNVKLTHIMNLEVDGDICDKMYCDSSHEYEDAVMLYEALRGLPEVMAADQTFWVSLAHSVFFPYVKKRWGKKLSTSSVLNHWFVGKGMMRHSLAGLWWTVRLTVDYTKTADPYRLTKVAFWNYSFRTTFMGPSIFLRIRSARTGILSYLADHEELKEGMENKGRFIAVYFNRLGATKQLEALPVEYFYKEMAANHDNKNNYNNRNKSVEEEELGDDYKKDVRENEAQTL